MDIDRRIDVIVNEWPNYENSTQFYNARLNASIYFT